MDRLGKHLGWGLLALLGASSLGYIALNRGEQINALWIVVAAVCVYLIAYRYYGLFIAKRVLAVDSSRMTPAVRHNDGLDYVPTDKKVLFGHHFAAIAGAGPLVGPVLAAQMGYLPGMLWLLAGVVLAGAVQDFMVLFMSTRRNGRSLGDMVREEMGKLAEAQETLQKASAISPNNSVRQRMVAEIAVRNDDLDVAERAYSKVLERHRGSSLRVIDDYTNLTRVMLDRGHTDGARMITQELRREWRGNKHGELAALVMDSLCCSQQGEPAKAKAALDKALALHADIGDDPKARALSQKIAVDLAHACLTSGEEERAKEILSKVAAENHEDRGMIAQIQGVFAKTGNEEAGQSMLAKVGREIVELNNRGVMAAQAGDLEGAVSMLSEAAEHVPNLQFLVNASKAIFTLLDRKGWNEEMGKRGIRYLQMAQTKEMLSPKVIAARELYHQVARKYGIEVVPIGGARAPGE